MNTTELPNIEETDRQKAVRELQIIMRHYGGLGDRDADWFFADLYRLIARADSRNLERLRLAFPDAVDVFLEWRRTGKVPEA